MPKPSKKFRLAADSIRSLVDSFETAVQGLPDDVRLTRQRIKGGPLLNAFAAYFVGLDPDERAAFARLATDSLSDLFPTWGVDDEAQQKSPVETGPGREPESEVIGSRRVVPEPVVPDLKQRADLIAKAKRREKA